MGNIDSLASNLTAIGNAIREKTGKSDLLTLDLMPIDIRSITTAGEIQELNITSNGTYDAPDGVDGYNPVTVDVKPNLGTLSVTENGTYYASDSEVDGYSSVTVNVHKDGSPSEKAFTITGNCNYRFAYNGWNWFIEEYGNLIITNNIDDATNMFYRYTLTVIPFDLNFDSNSSGRYHDLKNIFYGCNNITQVPKLNNVKVCYTNSMFEDCQKLRTIPEDIADTWDWSYIESQTSAYSSDLSDMFLSCSSLRSVPMNLIKSGNPNSNAPSSYYYDGFYNCYALDELINLPIPYTKATWNSNAFTNAFNECSRLKNVTFALNNGVPYIVTWKSQVIDLSNYVGYTNNSIKITGYNSGITSSKEITNATTYQSLKNDPDWFTVDINYSRYNHDSAVNTINSLPDTSAYLATAGGTNTIKFQGACGTNTDGGAINTLTEAEIAVATAKGWTVTLV